MWMRKYPDLLTKLKEDCRRDQFPDERKKNKENYYIFRLFLLIETLTLYEKISKMLNISSTLHCKSVIGNFTSTIFFYEAKFLM